MIVCCLAYCNEYTSILLTRSVLICYDEKNSNESTHLFNKYTDNLYTNIYLNAADELGIRFEIINKSPGIAHLIIGDTKIALFNNFLGVNSSASAKIAKDKELSAHLLGQITSIGPKYVVFDTKQDNPRTIARQIHLLAQQNNIVIKASSLFAGKGIYIHKKTKREIQHAVNELFVRHKVDKILVEPHFESTEEYRIMVYAGRIIDVLLRKAAFVVGDGKQTVQQLISQKNQVRSSHGFKLIQCDKSFLSDQGYTLTSIPKTTVNVQLQKACNLSLGGEIERRPLNSLHPDYSVIAKKLYEKTLLCLTGLDLMTTNPSAKPTPHNAFINEFNSNPGNDGPYFADVASGKGFYGVKKILVALKNDISR